MTNQLPKISEAELEIMKVLWSNSPQTANEIIEERRCNGLETENNPYIN